MSMRKSLQIIDYSVDVTGGAYGLTNIQTILGIILLILSILSILFKCGLSIYTHIKNKEIEKIQEDLEQATKELEKLKEGDHDE